MKWSAWEKVSGPDFDFKKLLYEKKKHLELEGRVARITLNRPDKFNSIDSEMKEEAFRAFYDASVDSGVGVVILTGAGGNFCAGGDLEWEKWGLRQSILFGYPLNRLVRLCRHPVIAVVSGYCIGGGNHLAYCCDLTIASNDAIFGQNGPRVSSPADGYFMPYLTRVVGAKKARELWMLCRRYSASEALEMGLVNKVVTADKLEAEVDKWCEDMLSASPGCLEGVKASFDWDIDQMPSLGLVTNAIHPDWFDTPEAKEGGPAFLEKRTPKFWQIREREAKALKKEREEL